MVEDSFFNRAVFGFLTKSGDFKNQSGAKTPAELALLLLALPLLLTFVTFVELPPLTAASHHGRLPDIQSSTDPFDEMTLLLLIHPFNKVVSSDRNFCISPKLSGVTVSTTRIIRIILLCS